MNLKRLVLFMTALIISIGVVAVIGTSYVSLDFADAQYYDDDDDDGGGNSNPNRIVDGVFRDGRLNGIDIDAPTVVFCERGTIAMYSAIGRGNARVTVGELVAAAQQAIQSGQAVTVTDSAPARLDVLPNRTLLLFAARSNSSSIYQFTFSLDACGTLNLASFSSSPAQANAGNTGGTYTVLPGDTLLRIARANGTTVNALVAANNISNPDRIFVGQRLVIP